MFNSIHEEHQRHEHTPKTAEQITRPQKQTAVAGKAQPIAETLAILELPHGLVISLRKL